MAVYRLIKNGEVVNTIVSDPKYLPELISQYDNVEEVFQTPIEPVQSETQSIVEKITKVSPVEFKLLFLSTERIALRNSTDPVIQDFYDIVDDPRLTFVDLTIPATIDALTYLVAVGVINERRKQQILNAENPTPDVIVVDNGGSANSNNESSNTETANTGP